MTETEALIALGEHDLAITRAERALDELPEKRAILKLRRRLEEIQGALESARVYREKADRLVARSVDETSGVTEKIEVEQARVSSGEISNPRELQAVTMEIDALSRRRSALEEETLALMEKSEAGAAQVARVEAAIEEGQAKESELIASFRAKGGKLQTELERLKTERDRLMASVSAPVRARYEELLKTKHGIAVGVLSDGVCSVCRTELPAERAQSLEAGPPLGECPNCRRILVIRTDADA